MDKEQKEMTPAALQLQHQCLNSDVSQRETSKPSGILLPSRNQGHSANYTVSSRSAKAFSLVNQQRGPSQRR
uniref:Uncharacterized protein n=1 Tax=Knipowitschia caucasica TaxID=637954 RepID=A0AAV2KA67_KNICA